MRHFQRIKMVSRDSYGQNLSFWCNGVPCCDTEHKGNASDGGVDLRALAVVRLDRPEDISVAADKLVRSGGFGLVVMDGESVPLHMQSRLAGLARKHAAGVLMLSEKVEKGGSAGPMVSLRCRAIRLDACS